MINNQKNINLKNNEVTSSLDLINLIKYSENHSNKHILIYNLTKKALNHEKLFNFQCFDYFYAAMSSCVTLKIYILIDFFNNATAFLDTAIKVDK